MFVIIQFSKILEHPLKPSVASEKDWFFFFSYYEIQKKEEKSFGGWQR